jgi:hypothetical protein
MAAIKAVPASKPEPKAGKTKTKSAVAFPYCNLATSIEVAKVMHDRAGGRCDREQLAGYLGYSGTNNGSFLTRVAAAKMFGLIEAEGDQLRVSARGRTIISPVTPAQAEGAKVDAFLAVELFRKVYEELKGTKMPGDVGLRNLIANYGVVKARVAPTVRIMKESAEEAGFFRAGGPEKMIKPSTSSVPLQSAPPPAENPSRDGPPPRHSGNGGAGGNGGGGNGGDIHPAFVGLLSELPAAGTPISEKRRTALVEALKQMVGFLYPEVESRPDD